MTEAELTLAWARAFLLTLAVELVVVVPALAQPEPSRWRRFAIVTIAQLVSHPVVWFVLPSLLASRSVLLVTSELWAWLSETFFYALIMPSLPTQTALRVALVANAASFALGLALRALGVNV